MKCAIAIPKFEDGLSADSSPTGCYQGLICHKIAPRFFGTGVFFRLRHIRLFFVGAVQYAMPFVEYLWIMAPAAAGAIIIAFLQYYRGKVCRMPG